MAACVNALSGEASLLAALRTPGRRGRVHSAFARAVNVVDGHGRLFTIAARALGEGPAALVVDAERLDGCEPGDDVGGDGRRLAAGALCVDLGGARAWHAPVHAWPRDPTALRANLAAVRKQLAGRVAAAATPVLAEATRSLVERRAARLVATLASGDAEAAAGHAIALLGVGPGLTPSGDDFLAGLLVVLAIHGAPGDALPGFAGRIVASARTRTHAISVAALAAAARGQARACVHGLIDAMLHGTLGEALAALARVLAIGGSSGADMAAGLVAGLDARLRTLQGSAWTARTPFRAA